MAQIGSLTIEMAANVARLQKDMAQASRTVNGAMGDITRSVGRAQATIEGVGSSINSAFSRLGGIIKSAFAVTAVYQFTDAVIQAGVAMQRLEKQFMAATGGKSLATTEIEYVRTVVQRLGLDFVETAGAYAKFSAALKGTVSEGAQGRKVFEGFATAATALSLSPAEMNSVMLALQQMYSKGRVYAEEMRLQLNERLPGAYQVAARVMGMTTAEFSKQMELGNIMAADLLPKMAAEFEKTYGQAATEGAKMAQAEFSRLNNLVFELKNRMSQVILPPTLAAVRALTDNINATADAIVALAQAIGSVAAGAMAGWLANMVRNFIAARVAAMALAHSSAIAASSAMGMSLALNASATAAAAAAAKYSLASVAATAASRAMALLGGPIGLVITLLGTAAAAWGFYSSRQEEAAKNSVGISDKVLEDLREENRLLIERKRLREEQGMEAMDMPNIDAYLKAVRAIETRMDALRKVMGAMQPGQLTANAPILVEYKKLQKERKELDEERDNNMRLRGEDNLRRLEMEVTEAKANYESVAMKVEHLRTVIADSKRLMDQARSALTVDDKGNLVGDAEKRLEYYKQALRYITAMKELENATKKSATAGEDGWDKVARQLQNDILKNSLSPIEVKLAEITRKADELRAKWGDRMEITAWEEAEKAAVDLDETLRQLIETRRELNEVMELSSGNWEAFRITFAEMDDDPLKEWREKYDGFADAVQERTGELSQFQIEAYRNMQTAAADFFEDALNGQLDSLEDYVSAFGKMINRMVAEYLAQMALMAAFGKDFGSGGPMGGLLGTALSFGASVFGGGATAAAGGGAGAIESGGFSVNPSNFTLRAEGGPIEPSKPYIVGERGPEIVVPKTAGTVIPNHQLGGTNVSFAITIGDDNRHLISQLESKVTKTVHEVLRQAS